MRVVVDRGRCSGMGICESVAPGRFRVGDDGVMVLLQERADTLAVLAAVSSCPAASLSVVDGPDEAGAPVPVASVVGSLAWGVKASFVEYVRAVGGSVEADQGAREEGTAFVFPGAGSAPADLEWRFAGRLTFRAHDGLLDVRIAEPWVRLEGVGLEGVGLEGVGLEDVELSATDERGTRVTVARGRSDGPLGTPIPVKLVAGAEHVFGFTYPAGTPLAHLVLLTATDQPDHDPA